MSRYAYQAINIFKSKLPYYEGYYEYINGVHTFTEVASGELWGVIQPITDAQMLMIPEGQRADLRFLLHTEQELAFSIPKDPEVINDTYIVYHGRDYKVVALGDWSNERIYRYGLTVRNKNR